MEIFKSELNRQADSTGFHANILEKVWRLLSVLQRINSDTYLKNKVALKGGTALNLFFFDVPRLSVDIDLNYMGPIETEKMLSERPQVEAAMEELFRKEQLSVQRIPKKHAGGKWSLKPSDISHNSWLYHKMIYAAFIEALQLRPLHHPRCRGRVQNVYGGWIVVGKHILLEIRRILVF